MEYGLFSISQILSIYCFEKLNILLHVKFYRALCNHDRKERNFSTFNFRIRIKKDARRKSFALQRTSPKGYWPASVYTHGKRENPFFDQGLPLTELQSILQSTLIPWQFDRVNLHSNFISTFQIEPNQLGRAILRGKRPFSLSAPN